MKEQYKGIICILIAAFFFALMNLFVKLAGDLPTFEKTFFRNIVAVVLAGTVIIKQKISLIPPKEAFPYLFWRSFMGTLGIFSNFYAITYLPISDASMLNKLSPFFAILFSYLLMKEKVTPFQIGCVLMAFIGALFILRPTPGSLTSFPAFIGFIGGACAGLAYTNVRLASLHGAKGPYIVFFFSTFSTFMSLPFFIINYTPMEWWQLGSLLLAGASAGCAQFAITAAYSHAPAKDISVYDYMQVIFAAILGFMFLSELPDTYSVIGYIIIIAAGVIMFMHNKKTTALQTN